MVFFKAEKENMQKSNSKSNSAKNKPSAAFKKQHPIALIRGIKRVCDDIKNIKDKDYLFLFLIFLRT